MLLKFQIHDALPSRCSLQSGRLDYMFERTSFQVCNLYDLIAPRPILFWILWPAGAPAACSLEKDANDRLLHWSIGQRGDTFKPPKIIKKKPAAHYTRAILKSCFYFPPSIIRLQNVDPQQSNSTPMVSLVRKSEERTCEERCVVVGGNGVTPLAMAITYWTFVALDCKNIQTFLVPGYILSKTVR